MPAKAVNVPVRFDGELAAELHKWAQHFDVTDAQMVRWACKALIRYVEMHGGRVPMPLDFSEFMTSREAAEEAIRLGREEDEAEALAERERREALAMAEPPAKYRAAKKGKAKPTR